MLKIIILIFSIIGAILISGIINWRFESTGIENCIQRVAKIITVIMGVGIIIFDIILIRN